MTWLGGNSGSALDAQPLDLRLRALLTAPHCPNCHGHSLVPTQFDDVVSCTACGERSRDGVHVGQCVDCNEHVSDLLVGADDRLRCGDCDERFTRARARDDRESSRETWIEAGAEMRGYL